MIEVRYERSRGMHRLSVRGHAGYAPRGSDIVCAAASILLLTAADLLRECGEGDKCGGARMHADRGASGDASKDTVISLSRGRALLSAPASGECDRVFSFAVRGLTLLADRYPDSVRLIP